MALLEDVIKKITRKDQEVKKKVTEMTRPAEKKPVVDVEHPAPLTNTFQGHTFHHASTDPKGVWFNNDERIVYISDPDAFVESGGRIENKSVTSAMDASMYHVYSSHGQENQLLYYRPENALYSVVAKPFDKYKPVEKSSDPRYKYKVIAAFQRMTGREVYGNQYDEIILPELKKRGVTTDELIQKYGKPGD